MRVCVCVCAPRDVRWDGWMELWCVLRHCHRERKAPPGHLRRAGRRNVGIFFFFLGKGTTTTQKKKHQKKKENAHNPPLPPPFFSGCLLQASKTQHSTAKQSTVRYGTVRLALLGFWGIRFSRKFKTRNGRIRLGIGWAASGVRSSRYRRCVGRAASSREREGEGGRKRKMSAFFLSFPFLVLFSSLVDSKNDLLVFDFLFGSPGCHPYLTRRFLSLAFLSKLVRAAVASPCMH